MLCELAVEEWNAGLDAVAEELLSETGIANPPVDAFAIAKRLGILVAWDDRQQGRARYVRLHDHGATCTRPTILLRPEPRFERRQWAIAHEIGEHAAYRVFDRWGVDPRETADGLREQAANQVACRLLLPTAWFARDAAACDWDLPALKRRYDTASHELIARRMLECSRPVIISIFDRGQLSFRHGNLPGETPPPSASEMTCWRAAHRRACERRVCDGAAMVQCWPIHEEGWRREIMRTEIKEWFS